MCRFLFVCSRSELTQPLDPRLDSGNLARPVDNFGAIAVLSKYCLLLLLLEFWYSLSQIPILASTFAVDKSPCRQRLHGFPDGLAAAPRPLHELSVRDHNGCIGLVPAGRLSEQDQEHAELSVSKSRKEVLNQVVGNLRPVRLIPR